MCAVASANTSNKIARSLYETLFRFYVPHKNDKYRNLISSDPCRFRKGWVICKSWNYPQRKEKKIACTLTQGTKKSFISIVIYNLIYYLFFEHQIFLRSKCFRRNSHLFMCILHTDWPVENKCEGKQKKPYPICRLN